MKMKTTDLITRKLLLAKRIVIASFTGCSLFFFTACQEDPYLPEPIQDPIIGCPPPQGGDPACNATTFVTVRDVVCGVGAWGSLWLQLDNGEYLQPWTVDGTFAVQDGQRFKIEYQPVMRDTRYDSLVTCLALVPPSEAINLTCMVPVNPTPGQCSVTVTADDVLCGFGVWGQMYFKLADGTHLQPWESTVSFHSLQDGQQYKIGYELMQPDNRYDSLVICAALPIDVFQVSSARITCIEAIVP